MNSSGCPKPSDVIDFLEGFGLKPVRLIAAQEVLAALAAKGRYPATAAELGLLMAPALFATVREQEQFRRQFRLKFGPPVAPVVEVPLIVRPLPRDDRRRRRFQLAARAMSVVAITVGAAFLSLRPAPPPPKKPPEEIKKAVKQRPEPPPPSLPALPQTVAQSGYVESDGKSVADAILYYLGHSTHSDRNGLFAINAPVQKTFALLATHGQYEASLQFPIGGSGTLHFSLRPKPGIPTPPGIAPRIPIPGVRPLWHGLVFGSMFGLILAGTGLWLLLQWMKLRRWTTAAGPRFWPISMAGATDGIFPSERLRRTAGVLRRSRSLGPQTLSVDRTVQRSTANGGYFTPVYQARTGIPEYLVLLGRTGPEDQLARYRQTLTEGLSDKQVNVSLYYFRSNPTICFTPEGEAIPLDRLASIFPGHCLWVFCDADQVTSPVSGENAEWLEAAARWWKDGLLLAPLADWGMGGPQDPVRRPLPASSPTLTGLLTALNRESSPPVAGAPRSAFPPLLREFPESWLEREPRPARVAARLRAELRGYLGAEGYLCLAACAVYPEMFWELTLWFAVKLIGQPELREETVRRLVALPWFRHGFLPEWLRLQLVAGLSDAEDARVRAALTDFLECPAAPGGARGRLADRHSGEKGPKQVRDYVFLSFLMAIKPDRLGVKPPGKLRKQLLRFGLVWRPATAALLCGAVLATAGTLVARHYLPAKTVLAPAARGGGGGATLDEFQARLLDVAASQVGLPSPARDFVQWTLDQTADIMGSPRYFTAQDVALKDVSPGLLVGSHLRYDQRGVLHLQSPGWAESISRQKLTGIYAGDGDIVRRSPLLIINDLSTFQRIARTPDPALANFPPHPVVTPPVLATGGPAPLLATGHPVNWWFAFKFNSKAFPGCADGATRTCLFGGTVQPYKTFSQQFVYASSEAASLRPGGACAGDSTADPIGATFDQVYNGTYHYVIWNDQFYDDPPIKDCGGACGAPWGHSKGMLAWNEAGEGFVLQVTTPSWPAAGSKVYPRKTDGNTLGCIKDNDVQVSQHFFSLRLTKDDVVKVLSAMQNASVATDPRNPQIVNNGGPADIQTLVNGLGVLSKGTNSTNDTLSSGVKLIAKPSQLNVPPWQLVSAAMGGVSLRAATWWAMPKINSTTASTPIGCWTPTLGKPGAVEIATTGQWSGALFGLTGGAGPDYNHAKIGVATSGKDSYSIFGDLNQQGTISGPNCGSSQNGRGGLFYVMDNPELFKSVSGLISGQTAPTGAKQ